MMARLARYAHISPGEFGRMTPARSRALDKAVHDLIDDEWKGYFELAKMVAMAGVRR
jgi:hypothetical protein